MKYESTALFTEDIKRAHQFYGGLLGLDVMMDNGDHIAYMSGLSIWDRKSAEKLIFGSEQPKPMGHKMELCFAVSDVEREYQRIKDAGAEILNPLTEQPWSQLVFRLLDPDGNIAEIAEPIAETFNRLHTSGLTLEEISKKTCTSVADLINVFGLQQ